MEWDRGQIFIEIIQGLFISSSNRWWKTMDRYGSYCTVSQQSINYFNSIVRLYRHEHGFEFGAGSLAPPPKLVSPKMSPKYPGFSVFKQNFDIGGGGGFGGRAPLRGGPRSCLVIQYNTVHSRIQEYRCMFGLLYLVFLY